MVVWAVMAVTVVMVVWAVTVVMVVGEVRTETEVTVVMEEWVEPVDTEEPEATLAKEELV